jgi:glycerate kinase
MSFLRAKPESGFELFAAYARLAERLERAALVITGEGALDRSTRMGKGVGRLAALCRRAGVPCVGLVGTAEPAVRCGRDWLAVLVLTDFQSQTQAQRRAKAGLEALAVRASGIFAQSVV